MRYQLDSFTTDQLQSILRELAKLHPYINYEFETDIREYMMLQEYNIVSKRCANDLHPSLYFVTKDEQEVLDYVENNYTVFTKGHWRGLEDRFGYLTTTMALLDNVPHSIKGCVDFAIYPRPIKQTEYAFLMTNNLHIVEQLGDCLNPIRDFGTVWVHDNQFREQYENEHDIPSSRITDYRYEILIERDLLNYILLDNGLFPSYPVGNFIRQIEDECRSVDAKQAVLFGFCTPNDAILINHYWQSMCNVEYTPDYDEMEF